MKLSYLRAMTALAITVGLSACGGKASFEVGGVISGLKTDGLVLGNINGDTVSPPAGATKFAFPKQIDYGTDYGITVLTNPAHMACSVTAGGAGNAGHTIAISASVMCVQKTHALGGTVSGLTAGSLVLTNGTSGGTVTLAAGATAFTFPLAVADGSPYGVTVLPPQPTGLKCSVAKGDGVMGTADVADIAVTCVPG